MIRALARWLVARIRRARPRHPPAPVLKPVRTLQSSQLILGVDGPGIDPVGAWDRQPIASNGWDVRPYCRCGSGMSSIRTSKQGDCESCRHAHDGDNICCRCHAVLGGRT